MAICAAAASEEDDVEEAVDAEDDDVRSSDEAVVDDEVVDGAAGAAVDVEDVCVSGCCVAVGGVVAVLEEEVGEQLDFESSVSSE